MINKPYKLFIGKDIDRTATLVAGEGFDVVSSDIANGEIVVLDKNMQVLADSDTYADSDKIYIAEGTSRVINYTDEAGNALTARHILLSDPIEGKRIRKVAYRPYEAKAEATATISAITQDIVAGTEYVLRIVYGDIEEHPGQFTQTYRYIAKDGDTSTDIFNGIRARIAKHKGTRVIASGTTTLVLTGKPVPEASTSVEGIDPFKMVTFDVFFNYVDNAGHWSEVTVDSDHVVTAAKFGSGNWEQIRDMEKFELGYRGVTNRTQFPVIKPDMRTVNGATYDVLVIEYDTAYRSPDNSYEKETSKQVILALETPESDVSTTAQYYIVQKTLATWLASTPYGESFTNVEANTTITATAIAGLTAPVKEAEPVTAITPGTGYTGTVVWYTATDNEVHTGAFEGATEYYAIVTIVPTEGYSLTGVTANQFTFAGSTAATNAANSGVCKVNFAATAA